MKDKKAKKKIKSKRLEERLWDAADQLRANSGLKASEYAQPVLGLIFLRFADAKFQKITQDLVKEGRLKSGASIIMDKTFNIDYYQAKGVMYLPENARYSYLLNLPEASNIGKAINDAMKSIEETNPDLKGILPKNYNKIESSILINLLKSFSEILTDIEGDIFGKIYEYFLGKFAKAEGSKGGEFFTPTSIVKLIVEIIEPYKGRVLDPACGSGGMFVQSANFIEKHKRNGDSAEKNIAIYGQEKTLETVYLCKMNLVVHGLSGDIKQTNTMYTDVFNSVGKFDFVMANPPFNVKGVDKEKVKNDKRYPFGIPSINNANYLWIQIFYSSLNKKGRAGFVMASGSESASDNSQKAIRKQIIEEDAVDVIVSVGNKFFFTVSVPCTLWFLDKNKKNTERKGKTLFIDAKKIFRQINAAHREFTLEQIEYMSNIVRLYRGKKIDNFLEFLNKNEKELNEMEVTTKEEEKEVTDRKKIIQDLRVKWEKNFKDNKYKDIDGLCKVANLDEIIKNDYALNPGRYVGIEEEEDDGIPFEDKMNKLVNELSEQFKQSKELEVRIRENLKKIGFKL